MVNKISDSELEIMRVLWREGRALSFAEIRKLLESSSEWSKSTIQTLVTRLREKGAILAENHHVTLYSANVNEEEYVQRAGQNFIDKLFDGSAKKLVAALCRGGHLQKSDVDELKAFFDMKDA